jgi:hypothetical protein
MIRAPWAAGAVRRGQVVRAASILGVVSILLLASCSSPSKTAKGTSSSSTTTTAVPTAACTSSSVTASVDYTTIGGSSTSPAGAVLFSDSGNTACSLRGVPTVQLVGADGQVIATFEAPSAPADRTPAVITPGGKKAGSSVTWSSLTCLSGSFSLSIEFPGWSGPVTAGSTSGYSGPPCTSTDQTVYVSPVEPVTAPAVVATTTTTTTSAG